MDKCYFSRREDTEIKNKTIIEKRTDVIHENPQKENG